MSNLIDELKEQFAPKKEDLVQNNESVLYRMFNIIGTTSFNSLFSDDLLNAYDKYVESLKEDIDE